LLTQSSANLSHDYFTNRQDRYYVFSSPEIVQYFYNIHRAICGFSYLLFPEPDENKECKYHLTWPAANFHDTPLHESNDFHSATMEVLFPLLRHQNIPGTEKCAGRKVDADTIIYPLAQFSPLLATNTSTEAQALETLLYLLSNILYGSSWLFTAGYFNPTPRLTSLLLKTRASGTVLTASPRANGFFNSCGVSGFLPAAYTVFSQRFLQSVSAARKSSEVILREWQRGTTGEPGGWTYHAKGLWVTGPGEDNPGLTVVGSSNYTKRSEQLDLEVGVMIVTQNEELKRRMRDEQRWLMENSSVVQEQDLRTPERSPGWLVVVLLWLVHILGASL
jgi:CDP-diacylglycerol---glycerol-3-phosphate 3-phosphatidyltransferase